MSSHTTSWHTLATPHVLKTLNVRADVGLSDTDIAERRTLYGTNELQTHTTLTVWDGIYKQLKSPLLVVLLVAGIVTMLLREWFDAIVIMFALVINTWVGAAQEGKAKRVFEALADTQEQYSTIVRNGKKVVLPSRDIVPGDIVHLASGDRVGADTRLLDANDLKINESILTGEWLAVAKSTAPLEKKMPLSQRANMAYAGTLVTEGYGAGVVVATGAHSAFGRIAHTVEEHDVHTLTPLQKSIRKLARLIVLVIFVALVAILLTGIVRGEALAEMFLVAIAVAVAAMPQGLPAAVTIVLALGMETILKKGGLVKSLLSAETLGATTVILTDKTGTLTRGIMTLEGLYSYDALKNPQHTESETTLALLRGAVLASDAFVEEDTERAGHLLVHGRPIEKAIMEAGLAHGLAQNALFANGHERIELSPFDTTRRFAASLNAAPNDGKRVYLTGSPESVFALCTKYNDTNGAQPLTESVRATFAQAQERFSAQGMRFTAIAYIPTQKETVSETLAQTNPHGVLLGLLAFHDAVREDVPDAIATVQRAGVRVVMATGDHPQTARAVAYAVGITHTEQSRVVTGEEMAAMDDNTLRDVLMQTPVLARVLPEQKLRIAQILQASGEVVAMTGDGVNDAPALVKADIGIAVGGGTDVAKGAADLILLENSFRVIVLAIEEGRKIVENVRRIVAYLLATGVGEVVVIGGALAIGAPLPFLPAQILWANMVEEGLMSFPFAFEKGSGDLMQRKPERREHILTATLLRFTAIASLVIGFVLLAFYLYLNAQALPIETVRTIMFVTLSLDSAFIAISFKNLHTPFWRASFADNTLLLYALLANVALVALVLLIPPLSTLLSLVTLSFPQLLLALLAGALSLACMEVVKYLTNEK